MLNRGTANMKCSEEVRSTTKRSAKSPASPGLLHPAGMISDLPTFGGAPGFVHHVFFKTHICNMCVCHSTYIYNKKHT